MPHADLVSARLDEPACLQPEFRISRDGSFKPYAMRTCTAKSPCRVRPRDRGPMSTTSRRSGSMLGRGLGSACTGGRLSCRPLLQSTSVGWPTPLCQTHCWASARRHAFVLRRLARYWDLHHRGNLRLLLPQLLCSPVSMGERKYRRNWAPILQLTVSENRSGVHRDTRMKRIER